MEEEEAEEDEEEAVEDVTLSLFSSLVASKCRMWTSFESASTPHSKAEVDDEGWGCEEEEEEEEEGEEEEDDDEGEEGV